MTNKVEGIKCTDRSLEGSLPLWLVHHEQPQKREKGTFYGWARYAGITFRVSKTWKIRKNGSKIGMLNRRRGKLGMANTFLQRSLTLKEPGRNPPPPSTFFLLYLCRLLFFCAETSWPFFFKPCARFKTIFIKIRPRVMTLRYVIARWVQRYWFSIEITHKSCFLSFLSFRIHFHYVLSYLFGLCGVRTCVSILWHTSLLKHATFAWKSSEKPWFWRFLVIFVFLTWRHLWRHCDVIQGMFWIFWYQWTREGHSYSLVSHTWCFIDRFSRS